MADNADQHFSLPPGTRLEEYEIVSVIGHGSFGLTYLAEDTNLGTQVAIKEYLPGDTAFRDSTRTVRPRSAGLSDTLERGKDAFLKEARTLALVSHPNIVKVRRFFRAFGTAYIAMDFIGGRSLADILDHDFPAGGYPAALLERLMSALLDGLGALHRAGIIHRDLKPGNILIEPSGNPMLVDFGAARNFQRSLQRAMTVIMTPGYAPIEQYSDGDRQGPFTDIYALGAVAYRAIAGRPPEEPYRRLMGAALEPASAAGAGKYPPALLTAVDWALAVQPQDRPQTAAALVTVLRTGGDVAGATRLAGARPAEEATRLIQRGTATTAPEPAPLTASRAERLAIAEPERPARAGRALRWIALTLGLVALLGAATYLVMVRPAPPIAGSGAGPEATASDSERGAAEARRAAARAEAERQAAAEAERQAAAEAEKERAERAKNAEEHATAEAPPPSGIDKAAPARSETAGSEAPPRAGAAPQPGATPPPTPSEAPPAADAGPQPGSTAPPAPSVAGGPDTESALDATEPEKQPEREATNRIKLEEGRRRPVGIAKFMGLSLANLTPELSQRYGLADASSGVVVTGIEGKSEAAAKGVRAGDVIVEVVESGTRRAVRSAKDLTIALDAARKSGANTLQLLLGRQGDRRAITLELDHGTARVRDPRCASIVENSQLGEALSNEDRTYLEEHCR
ncbi:MAG TPA: protein kinase [Stellaceae bacterium]|nr:protein kinase [Stellaceae bacterium]